MPSLPFAAVRGSPGSNCPCGASECAARPCRRESPTRAHGSRCDARSNGYQSIAGNAGRGRVEQYEAAESKLTSKYEQALRDSSAALLNLLASGAKLEGELQTNPFSNDYDEPVTGFFAIVKGNEGTLTIESRKDKAKRLLCHFRLLTPDVVKADASISAPLAAKRTLILSPEHPGDQFYGDFYKWNKFEGYLGLTGNILSGEIGSEAIFGTHVKLRFTMPSG